MATSKGTRAVARWETRGRQVVLGAGGAVDMKRIFRCGRVGARVDKRVRVCMCICLCACACVCACLCACEHVWGLPVS